MCVTQGKWFEPGNILSVSRFTPASSLTHPQHMSLVALICKGCSDLLCIWKQYLFKLLPINCMNDIARVLEWILTYFHWLIVNQGMESVSLLHLVGASFIPKSGLLMGPGLGRTIIKCPLRPTSLYFEREKSLF